MQTNQITIMFFWSKYGSNIVKMRIVNAYEEHINFENKYEIKTYF